MKLYFRKSGKGRPLIILHGLYGSSDNWYSFGKALSKFYEVYLIDLRNHGRSPHSEEHNYSLMIKDLAEFFDLHRLENAVVIGHSMGGKTAMLFAYCYPSMIEKLVVVDASPKSYANDPRIAGQINQHRTIVNALENLDISVIHTREDANEILAEDIRDERIRLFLLKNLKRKPDGHYFWALNIKVISRNLESILNDFNTDLCRDEMVIRNFPALFIKGQLSNYLLEEDKDKIAKLFPNAGLVTIPNAGHWVHAEQPELFLSVLKKFLQQEN
jgi:esterase